MMGSIKFYNKDLVSKIFGLLPRKAKQKIIVLCGFQLFVTTLDIVAILLLGTVSKLGFDYVQGNEQEFPLFLSKYLGISTLDFEKQFVLVSGFILFLFTTRTFITIKGNRRIIFFLSNQGTIASNNFLSAIFRSKPEYITSKKSQELLYGATTGMDNLVVGYLGSLTLIITEAFFLLSTLIVIVIVQPLTGVCAIIIFSGAFFNINKLTSSKGRAISVKLTSLSINYNQNLLETIQIFRELLLRGKTAANVNRIQDVRRDILKYRAELSFLPLLSKYLFEFILVFGSAFVALAQLLVSNALSAVSALVMFLAAASRILPSLIRAQGSLLSMRQSEGNSEIIIKQLQEIDYGNSRFDTGRISTHSSTLFVPKIEIFDLSFSYSDESPFSLQNISLDIGPGKLVAIVGESGSGKTTFVDLILGMQSPTSGSVKISGIDAASAIMNWPGKIAYVPQDITIIDGSIRRNVTLCEDGDYSDEIVFKALERAHLLSDVLKLPNGLNENVGERGFKLSGGQRQRLGIARALLTDPELIIFDEATSALDPITERAVTDGIYEKKGNVTLIVIAHRLSTVKNADLIVLLEDGKLVEKGTFEEVRKKVPKFDYQAKLVNL